MTEPPPALPDPPPALPDPPPAALRLFGDRLELAIRYAELLSGVAVEHGLLGPREVPRIWERHLLNCGLLAELVPPDSAVLDVGSGAGLPGLVLAIARPDLSVTLVEPMARRVRFLDECVRQLGLRGTRVVRARAEEAGLCAPVVTARAVAPLDRLVEICLPVVALGGQLLAVKGDTAESELTRVRPLLRANWPGVHAEIVHLGVPSAAVAVTVIRVRVPARSPGTARRFGRGPGP